MSDQGTGALCELRTAGRLFGLETRRIREVLGACVVQRVPLAPAGIAGMVAYRGEVLVTVSLSAVLGERRGQPERCVVVLKGDPDWKGDAEDFGLAVEAVGDVIEAFAGVEGDGEMGALRRLSALGAFDELSLEEERIAVRSYRVRDEVLLQLDVEQLKPMVLGRRMGWQGSGV